MAEPTARVQPVAEPEPKGRPHPLRHVWFGWWVFTCVAALAYHAAEQLAIQERILAGSRELQAIVAEAEQVSADMQEQLTVVRELQLVTEQLDERLAAVVAVNGRVGADLAALEETVAMVVQLIDRLEGQTQVSQETLEAIRRESLQLKAALEATSAHGLEVSGALNKMVELQLRINADMATMDYNTRILDDFIGGR